jgi:hypothetical protein
MPDTTSKEYHRIDGLPRPEVDARRLPPHQSPACHPAPARDSQLRYNGPVPPENLSSSSAHKPLRFKTFLMILVMIVAGPVGNVLLGFGMKHAGPIALWPLPVLIHTGSVVFSIPYIWLGVASLITFMVSWMLALSWADYSFVRPASSLAYGIVAILGWVMLGEHVSPLRWAGIAVICLGVVVVGRTAPKTTPTNAAEPA